MKAEKRETDNVIQEVVLEILKNGKGSDFSDILVLFPNKRPSYYLLNSFSEKMKTPFFPPRICSITEFFENLIWQLRPGFAPISQLDAVWLLYETLKEMGLFTGFNFHRFYFWGIRILSVLSELETEDVPDNKLKNLPIERIPDEIKKVITKLGQVRTNFRKVLEEKGFYTTAIACRIVAESPDKSMLEPWRKIIVAGFFKNTVTEQRLLDFIAGSGKAVQISREENNVWNTERITIHAAFDTHSQIKRIGEILKEKSGYSSTAVVMPRPDALIPLLWNVMEDIDTQYNITMGYPMRRTSLFTFLDGIMKLQETKTAEGYYAKSYLSVLLHPYVKNISAKISAEDMRETIRDAERWLVEKNAKPFIKLEEIEKQFPVLREINGLLAGRIENINTPEGLAAGFLEILSFIVNYSLVKDYPFSEEILDGMFRVFDELSASLCKSEKMEKENLFDLFRYHVDTIRIPFRGIPLGGLQVMGLLETRNLRFDRVVIMDVQEGVLPDESRIDPILPESVREFLGLPKCKDREEIFRRYFMDIVNTAKEAHLIYCEHDRDTRSRFVEEIIWEKQKKAKQEEGRFKQDSEFIKPVSERAEIQASGFKPVEKTSEVIKELERMTFSPSKIDAYLKCPAKFYFSYILGLEEKKEIEEDPDSGSIGRCVHSVLKRLFDPFTDKTVSAGVLKAIEGMLEKVVEEETEKMYGNVRGNNYLISEIIKFRLSYLLKKHRNIGEFVLKGTEKELYAEFDGIKNSAGKVTIHGIIDRIDARQDGMMIVDYKTGSGKYPNRQKKFDVTLLNNRETIKEMVKSFQLPVYVYLVKKNAGDNSELDYGKINAAYFNMSDMDEVQLFGDVPYCRKLTREEVMEKTFLPLLRTIISEIFNPQVPFEAADKDDEESCKYCPFGSFCA